MSLRQKQFIQLLIFVQELVHDNFTFSCFLTAILSQVLGLTTDQYFVILHAVLPALWYIRLYYVTEFIYLTEVLREVVRKLTTV
jgi:hypothetical protein